MATAPAICTAEPLHQPQLTFDFDLLLACCIAPPKRLHPESFGTVSAESFVELATRHRVVARVYEAAAQLGLPETIRERLHGQLIMQAEQSLWLTRELIRIIEHFETRKISVMPFKGPVLSQILYSNVASRQFGDLDLLVHPRDVGRAKAALIELGFTPSLRLRFREEKAYLSSANEYVFNRGRERNLVELHWRILPRFYAIEFNTESLFERSVSVELGGRALRTLCAEDLVLVLCVHAAKHAWTNLSWLCDLDQLIRSTHLAWEVLQARARELGIERIVATNFALMKSLLGSEGLSNDTDFAVSEITGELVGLMRHSREYDADSADYFRLMLRVRERWQDRLLFLSRLAFTPGLSEWQSVKLHRALFPLYRVIRVSRLAARLAA